VTDTEHLVRDTALRLVEEKRRFSAADHGELIDDGEVRLCLEQQERS
jgi:hypothetical protein